MKFINTLYLILAASVLSAPVAEPVAQPEANELGASLDGYSLTARGLVNSLLTAQPTIASRLFMFVLTGALPTATKFLDL